ncbi:uncharacterized protein [Elaeis guineensis]|uniref:uncharacterized protein n=1 Tax=Elaeis guineensis var. tenera TaxID=51953 RepID=UPI003C6D3548
MAKVWWKLGRKAKEWHVLKGNLWLISESLVVQNVWGCGTPTFVRLQISEICKSRVYIDTTKQQISDALLQELEGVIIPSERIYKVGTEPKVQVLKELQAMPEHEGLTLHFVENLLAILKNVTKGPAFNQWNLYLGRWECNTAKEREEAESIPRIHVLDPSDFNKKLR